MLLSCASMHGVKQCIGESILLIRMKQQDPSLVGVSANFEVMHQHHHDGRHETYFEKQMKAENGREKMWTGNKTKRSEQARNEKK